MLRHIFCGLFTLAALSLNAQTSTNHQSVSLAGIEHVSVFASFSSIVLSPGTGSEVEVEHSIVINGEEEPQMSELSVKKRGSTLEIRELNPTFEQLKERFPDGFSAQDNHYYGSMDQQAKTTVESFLKLKIPAGVTVEVETEYGSIHAKNVVGLQEAYAKYGEITIVLAPTCRIEDLRFHSHYGVVDLTIPKNTGADLKLNTEYGELFSDFDIQVNASESKEENFLQQLVGTVGGGGKSISCKAPYGNVYLRRGI